ncbi:MAG: protein kinase [Candidatus Thermoplasmatota archaeon]|jgi:serine/threonine protein kinase|nr:protein kinase [Candidatus Thermoplasmatota archaeon]MCL5789405.1 protein kinase [Candidatus Thermoplasmatota archaeon]
MNTSYPARRDDEIFINLTPLRYLVEVKGISDTPESFQNGRYKILKKLGEGGKGIVYKCLDNNLNRIVAIKLIKGEVTEGDSYNRILREAETTAKMLHPNIVAIYDMQREGNKFYMVMEFVDGENLQEYVFRNHGRLSVTEVLRITKSVANALEYAHNRGIFHRDIKPENIMMTKDGTPKIMDFGLAKAFDAPMLTHAGTIVGTPAYISPEGALGNIVDARSDLYSLGCVIYFMSTGHPPFESRDSIQLIYSHIHDYPLSPSSINSNIPKQLDAIIMKLLRKNPQERFRDAGKLIGAVKDIEDLTNTQGTEVRSTMSSYSNSSISASTSRTNIGNSQLIGLEEEMSTLRAALDSAMLGEGKAIIVVGDHGQGKTRMVQDLMDYGLLRGLKVIIAKGRENRASSPNYIFSELLREIFSEMPQQLMFKVCGNYGDVAIKLLPDLVGKLGRVNDLFTQNPEDAAVRFLDGIYEIFRNIGRETPFLLEIEDINFADSGSLNIINSLLDGIKNIKMLLVMTSVPVDDQENPLLEKIMGSRKVQSLRLHNLDKDQTAELIARNLGEKKSNISVEFSNFIYSRTEGNPFYVEEVLKLLIEKRMIFRKDSGSWDRKPINEIGIPSSVRGLIRERLSSVGETSKEILSVASVIGQEFDLEILEKLMDSVDSDTLYNEIEKLEKGRILLEKKTRPGQFRLYFENPQVHDFFFNSISMLRKKKLHLRIAEIMLSTYGDEDKDVLPDLAYHTLEGGDYLNALKFGISLGDLWASSFQFNRAADQYRSDLEIMDMIPNYSKSNEGKKQKAMILYKTYYYGLFSGITDFESIEQAIRIFESLNDVEMMAKCLSGMVARSDQRQDYWLKYATDFLEKNLTDPASKNYLQRLAYSISGAHWYRSEFKEAREVNGKVLEYVTETGVNDIYTIALRLQSGNLIEIKERSDIDYILKINQDAERWVIRSTAEDPNNVELQNVALTFYDHYANVYVFLKHDLMGTEAAFSKGLAFNLDLCTKRTREVIEYERGLLSLLPGGRWEQLKKLLENNEVDESKGNHVSLVSTLIKSVIEAFKGNWNIAMNGFNEVDKASSAQFLSFSSPYKAMSLVEQNKLEEAVSYAHSIIEKIENKILNTEVFDAYVNMSYYSSIASALLGKKEDAERYLKVLNDFSSRFREEWISQYRNAAESYYEEKFGDIEKAVVSMREARDYFLKTGYVLFGAQLSYELARLLQKDNDWEGSDNALSVAYDIFDRLNCVPFAEKCLRLKGLLNA